MAFAAAALELTPPVVALFAIEWGGAAVHSFGKSVTALAAALLG